jgi:hypothetical protein
VSASPELRERKRHAAAQRALAEDTLMRLAGEAGTCSVQVEDGVAEEPLRLAPGVRPRLGRRLAARDPIVLAACRRADGGGACCERAWAGEAGPW